MFQFYTDRKKNLKSLGRNYARKLCGLTHIKGEAAALFLTWPKKYGFNVQTARVFDFFCVYARDREGLMAQIFKEKRQIQSVVHGLAKYHHLQNSSFSCFLASSKIVWFVYASFSVKVANFWSKRLRPDDLSMTNHNYFFKLFWFSFGSLLDRFFNKGGAQCLCLTKWLTEFWLRENIGTLDFS